MASLKLDSRARVGEILPPFLCIQYLERMRLLSVSAVDFSEVHEQTSATLTLSDGKIIEDGDILLYAARLAKNTAHNEFNVGPVT